MARNRAVGAGGGAGWGTGGTRLVGENSKTKAWIMATATPNSFIWRGYMQGWLNDNCFEAQDNLSSILGQLHESSAFTDTVSLRFGWAFVFLTSCLLHVSLALDSGVVGQVGTRCKKTGFLSPTQPNLDASCNSPQFGHPGESEFL